jgi:hypothetical protein
VKIKKSEIMDKVKHRIIRDSHARRLANERKDKLTCEFESQGMVKPLSTLDKLVLNPDSDLKELSMSDVCVVWGGSKDVARNESNLGIRVIEQIVSSLNHTNVIVIEVPHRHDLVPNSYVNSEVLMFNRKLKKLKKVYPDLNSSISGHST